MEFLQVVARLSGNALNWAWRNRGIVMEWLSHSSINAVVRRILNRF